MSQKNTMHTHILPSLKSNTTEDSALLCDKIRVLTVAFWVLHECKLGVGVGSRTSNTTEDSALLCNKISGVHGSLWGVGRV